MIPNLSKLLVLNAKYDASEKRKNQWKKSRIDALEYYKGRSIHIQAHFSTRLYLKKFRLPI